MANDSNTDAVVEAPKKKNPTLLIVLIINSVAILGLAAFFLLKPGDAGAKEKEEQAGPMGVQVGGPIDPKTFAISDMMPYIVNLREDGGTRYLKIAITLRLRSPEILDSFKTVQKAVRDRFIQHLTDLTIEDLQGTENKLALKAKLVELANQTLGRPDVVDTYFTDFVIQ